MVVAVEVVEVAAVRVAVAEVVVVAVIVIKDCTAIFYLFCDSRLRGVFVAKLERRRRREAA